MGVPQFIYIIITAIRLLTAVNKHGKLTMEDHNFWLALASTLIHLGILMWGGFFAC